MVDVHKEISLWFEWSIAATSEGTPEGLENRIGGLCKDKQMKIKFEVKPGTVDGYYKHTVKFQLLYLPE